MKNKKLTLKEFFEQCLNSSVTIFEDGDKKITVFPFEVNKIHIYYRGNYVTSTDDMNYAVEVFNKL